ncbi:MAG: carbonic anhydrase, partial [Pirellula sp.]
MLLSRRQFVRTTTLATAVAASAAIPLEVDAAQSNSTSLSAEEALSSLKDGNKRFVSGNLRYPHTGKEWLKGLVKGQAPFATILGCSDSRVPPELLFDQGFGDLFVVRVAGNVVDVDVEGSIEYSVDHCGTRLVVVMGHQGCGAVTAALKSSGDLKNEPN